MTNEPADEQKDKLDELLEQGAPPQAVSFQEWLYGDVTKLSPASRQLRLRMLNSPEFRALVFRAEGMDPEVEFAKLREQSRGPGNSD